MKSRPTAAQRADNDGVIDAPLFRTRATPRRRVALFCDPEGDRAQQQFKAECDINNIMARYLKTGILPQSTAEPVYLDTTAYDFLEAQNLVARARGEFSLLSAEERDSYGNSVELWLDAKAQEAQEAAEAAAKGGDSTPPASVAPAPSSTNVEAPAKPDTPPVPPKAAK